VDIKHIRQGLKGSGHMNKKSVKSGQMKTTDVKSLHMDPGSGEIRHIGRKPARTGIAAILMTVLLAAAAGHFISTGSIYQADKAGISRTERFNMTYIYFGNSAAYISHVDSTRGSLDHIAPSYFDLNRDGTLRLTIALDRNFIDAMHERGIRVTPFLSNHWDEESGKNALDRRGPLAEEIVEAVKEYDLDGVNVDIENMTEEERDKYTDFVRLLRQKLPADKSVSVAVAANPSGLTKGWHASYDLAGLSQHSDYLMLMAYDQHWQGNVEKTGGAGPVAGLGFVEESVKAALREVPVEKLVLGIPFYGRFWKRGAAYGGYGISNNTVEELVREFKGKVVFDEQLGSPKAVITIKKGDRKPVIYGVALDPGTYDIWYENEASIKRKLELVKKYGLKGTGSWSLGQETKETWDYYTLWLEGIYFSDIQRHWAKASIAAAVHNGWMNGVSGTRFEPDAPMTRAQAAALLVRVLDIRTSSDTAIFADTAGHWAEEAICAAAEAGIFKGVGGNRFEPDKALTREQMAVLLDRLLNNDSDNDSDSDSTSGGGIGNGVSSGDISGGNSDMRNSSNDISSEYGSSGNSEISGSSGNSKISGNSGNDMRNSSNDISDENDSIVITGPTSFCDVYPTVTWSYDAICRMADKGFVKGFPDGTFRPRDAISRSQMAVLMERIALFLSLNRS
jgi:spore germination protein YaaH